MKNKLFKTAVKKAASLLKGGFTLQMTYRSIEINFPSLEAWDVLEEAVK